MLIIESKPNLLVIYNFLPTLHFLFQHTEKPMPDFYIPLDKVNGAKHKERVVARFIEWEKENKKPCR